MRTARRFVTVNLPIADATFTLRSHSARTMTCSSRKAQARSVLPLPQVTTSPGSIGVSAWDCPEWDAIKLKDRRVYIVYDSDAASNPQVSLQENNFARFLFQDKKAIPFIVRLPGSKDGKKVGWDDYLRDHVKEAFDKLVASAKEFEKSEALYQLNEEVRYIKNPSAIIKLENGQVMSERRSPTRRFMTTFITS